MEFRTLREYIQCHLENPQQMPYHFGNKLEVRDLADKLGINTPREYMRSLDIENIDFDQLPDEFVIKPDNLHSLSGVRLVKRLDDNLYYEYFSKRKSSQETIKKYLASLVKPYRINTYIFEEFVHGPLPEHVQPLDYKLHVFNGQTVFIAQENRGSDPFSVVFSDASFADLTDELTFTGSRWQKAALVKPDNSAQMLAAANKIGEALNIPYVRVDMYSDNKNFYLGEVTLYPGGIYKGNYYKISKATDEYCGGLIRAAYKKNGWKIPQFFKALPEKYYRTKKDETQIQADMEKFFVNSILEIFSKQPLDHKPVETRNVHILDKFENFYGIVGTFGDEDSRNLYLKLLKLKLALTFMPDGDAYRYFGIYSEEEWSRLRNEKNFPSLCVEDSYLLDKIEIFLLEGYSYKNLCKVEKNDVVIDCGAYTGNSALYFADLAGPGGKVFAFELYPPSFAKLVQNVNNVERSGIAPVIPILKGVFDKKTSVSLGSYNNMSSSFRIAGINQDDSEDNVIPLDDFVEENKLDKVNFIKMDIEGSEEKALRGAAKTIKKFSPKMAICIYHKQEDYYRLTETILDINPGYEFYLKHNAFNIGETVLFCKPSRFPKDIYPCHRTEELSSHISFFLDTRNERVRNLRSKFYQRVENLISGYDYLEINPSSHSDKSYWPIFIIRIPQIHSL